MERGVVRVIAVRAIDVVATEADVITARTPPINP